MAEPEIEIVEPNQETAIQAAEPVTANGLLQMAIDKDLDVEKLRMLMDLKDRDEAKQAKKAYVAAMSAFHAQCPQITKTRTVDFTSQKGRTHYNHAGLAETLAQIKRTMAKCGLFASWRTNVKEGVVIVTCVITHEGHSEETSLPGTPDQSGNKNPIQAVGSTVTYLQRYTLFVLLGLAAMDQDDDGNASEPEETIDEETAAALAVRITVCGADNDKFLKYFRIERIGDMTVSQYKKADKMLQEREDGQKKNG